MDGIVLMNYLRIVLQSPEADLVRYFQFFFQFLNPC